MKTFRWLGLAVALLLLAGCAPGDGPISSLFPTPTPLPTPRVGITSVPDAAPAMSAFLEALKKEDYAAMYALLDKTSQAAITQEDFSARYLDALNKMSAASLDYEVGAATTSPVAAQAPFRLTYHSTLAGDIARDMTARLTLEDGQWRLAWTPELILPELADGNQLALDCKAPARGDIFDRQGLPMVSTTEAVALGVNTGTVNFDRLFDLTYELWRVTGISPEGLANKILASGPGWYIPVGTTSREEARAC